MKGEKGDYLTMKELFDAWRSVDRNKIAALLSVVPGAGHLYKHHYLAGAGILIVGNALMVFVAAWLSIATVGLSLLLVPALWVAGIAYAAYSAPDRHGTHPWLLVRGNSWAHAFRTRGRH